MKDYRILLSLSSPDQAKDTYAATNTVSVVVFFDGEQEKANQSLQSDGSIKLSYVPEPSPVLLLGFVTLEVGAIRRSNRSVS